MATDRDAVAEINGEEIVIRIRMPKAPASEPGGVDRLIRLEQQACTEAGFELRGLQTKVRAGELPTVKIGRAYYVRVSDLCALAKPLAPRPAPDADVDEAFARALATPRRQRRGAVHGA